MLDSIAHDLKLAFRSALGAPTVTVVAVLSLALGIAANATVFSLVQAVEFPSLIYPDSSRLVLVESRNRARDLAQMPISAPDAFDVAAATRTLDTPALTVDLTAAIPEAVTPTRFGGRQVTPDFFRVLRVGATQGRFFDGTDAASAIVLSESLARREFGSDTPLLGRVIHLDDAPMTVIGVMPAKFDADADFWVPLSASIGAASARDDRQFTLFAQLAAGATLIDAARELAIVGARLAADHPATNGGWELFPTPLSRLHGQDSRGVFFLLQGAVAVVLLIACANIANILLARGTRRRYEMALRVALGADRRRLIRQLLAESLLLAALGGVLGVLLTMWGIRLARVLGGFPAVIDPALNLTVVAFTAGVSMITGIACGILPAMRASSASPQIVLQADGGRGTASATRGRLRTTLVVVQIASAIVLATAAGLMLQTMLHRQRVDLGFDPTGAAQARLSLSGARYASDDAVRTAVDATIAAVAGRPDVASAGAVAFAMTRGAGAELPVVDMRTGRAALPVGTRRGAEAITPDYLSAMGIPLRQGRHFTAADRAGTPAVAIVNEEFARRAFGNRSPLGERLRLGSSADASSPVVTVVGVAGTVRRSAMHPFVVARVYLPFAQVPSPDVTLVARARGDATVALIALQRGIRGVDTALVLEDEGTVASDLAAFLAPLRLISLLFAGFGVTGVLLAALGVFGTMSYAVSQRQREMAVRAALGAGRARILRLVIVRGLKTTMVGVAIGVPVALASARVLDAWLFGVAATDPWTLAGVVALLTGAALVACYLPARRAASMDPMTVLRRD